MPRASVVPILVLAALTSCATISGLADKEAVDCPGDCEGGPLPPRNDDASTDPTDANGTSDGADAPVVIDAAPKCDPATSATCIALPDGWALVTGTLANDPSGGTCANGAKPLAVKETPFTQAAACTCDTCTVTTPATCSGALDHEFSVGGACSVNGDPTYYQNPVAGTCYQDLHTGARAAVANRFRLPDPSGGACSATPTKHTDRVNYAASYSLCDEASRCSGGFCDVTGIPDIATCAARTGDEACPAGFPSKHIVGSDGADFDCGNCSCNLNRPTCTGSVNHYTDANCTNGLVMIPGNAGCGGPNTSGSTFASYKVVATSATTCNTGGGASASNARMKNPRTVCCRK